MKTTKWESLFPEDKKYLACLPEWAEQVMERWKSHPLLTDTARTQAALLLAGRMETVAGASLRDMWEQRMKEKNPLLSLDVRLATREEKEEAVQTLLAELKQSEGRVLFEHRPLLPGELERCAERFERWFGELLERVELRCGDISGAFFDGADFGRITGITADQADLHFHGRSAAVISTENGRFLYKPRSCALDEFYSRLVDKWFSDITHAPRVVMGEDHGFCEFVVGELPSSREDLATYFFNFGGLCALFQALGSTDLHFENFIARGRYPVLVDMETLLTPIPRVFNDPAIFPETPSQQEDFISDQNRSLYPSGLLPDLRGDTQMSPLLASSLPNIWGYEGAFFDGFSDIYDRCMEIREPLAEFLRVAGSFTVRKLLRQSSYYARLLERLYAPKVLSSSEAWEGLSARLGNYFRRHGAEHLQSIADWEAECLREGDIPYFTCRGDGTDLLGYGQQVVAKDFFERSPLCNAEKRLERMSQREKQFELTILRQSLESALRPIPEEKRVPLPAAEEMKHPLDKAEALAQAEEIFCQLRDRAVTSPCGEVGWFMQGGDEGRFMYARPTLFQGTAGLGVFFAGIYKATADDRLRSQAKQLCLAVLDQLCRHMEPLGNARTIPEEILPLGLSVGAAGSLKSLVIMGRCLGEETTGHITDRLLSLLGKIRIAESRRSDVISGAAGLLQVLCGYRELRSHPLASGTMADCADKLLAARTLQTKSGRLLWDTMDLGRPVSGMGHGIAGIGAALQMAGAFLHREDCLSVAEEALDWEYQTYSEKLGTWPDFRGSSLAENFMHGYCSGAPGIGLAMLLYGEWEETGPLQQKNLERSITACQSFPMHPRDHLCCGNSASVEFLLEAGRRLEREESVLAAGRLLARMVARKEQLGHFCYLPPSYHHHLEPSLFYGAAGVGYELLRWSNESLPSVLM